VVIDVVVVLIDVAEIDDGVVIRLVERDIIPLKMYHSTDAVKSNISHGPFRVSEGLLIVRRCRASDFQ
jgi:hypothetical protein